MLIEARKLADESHSLKDQRRKGTGEPYIVHLDAVVANLMLHGVLEHTILAAAYLHDTVEDTDLMLAEIEAKLGPKVAHLVSEVTDVYVLPEHGNRAQRKALERARLADVSEDAKAIKLADIIDNVSTIVETDPDFAPKYLAEKKALLAVLKTDRYAGLYRSAEGAVRTSLEKLEALRA